MLLAGCTLLGFLLACQTSEPFTSQEVSWTGFRGFALNGTLLCPKTDDEGPRPAVLLLPGSGPTDRNGNQTGFRTDLLKQFAETLSSNGLVTLRFDKRACAVYAKSWPTKPAEWGEFFSWENHRADLQAAFRFLRSRPEVDPARCALLGHSEGGMFALDSAKALKPAAIVLLGTPGRTLERVLDDQLRSALKRQSAPRDLAKEILVKNSEIVRTIVETGILPKDIPPSLKALYSPTTVPYIRTMASIIPTDLARGYPGPTLVMNGGSDIQVHPSKDAETLFAALASRPKGVQELIIVPSASHNFKLVRDASDIGFEGPVVPSALDKAVAWLRAQLIMGRRR